MKLLFILSLLTLFTFSCSKELTISKNIGYYFCYSHQGKPFERPTTSYILYTDILAIEKDEQVITEKATKWGNMVNTICKNTGGCTSDLMFYQTFEEADAMRNKMFESYQNTEKYQIDKVKFR